MSNIDWSKAPEGTTHHHPQTELITEHWYREGFFCNVGFEMHGWQKDISPLQSGQYQERPSEEKSVAAELCSFAPSRDDFALAAMQAMLTRHPSTSPKLTALEAYALADAMLAERAK